MDETHTHTHILTHPYTHAHTHILTHAAIPATYYLLQGIAQTKVMIEDTCRKCYIVGLKPKLYGCEANF